MTSSDTPGHTTANGSELSAGQAALRFLLEVAALVCWGVVGWRIGSGALGWVLAIGLPVVAAAVWGAFRVPGDHSANGGAPVAVPGVVRLMIELDVLLGAAVLAAIFWNRWVGIVLGVLVFVHYAMTLRRVRWMLDQLPT